MGIDDNAISTDIKNHRIRVIDRVDIIYKGIKYNMFFEFSRGAYCQYKTTNEKTGKPLKKAVSPKSFPITLIESS